MRTDYENIVDYKQNNSQEAFNELYNKYYKYVREYARNIYYKINECDGGVLQEDIEQNLIGNCILQQLYNIDINRIRPNFTFKVRLAMYLKGYRNYYIKKYKKHGISYSVDYCGFDNHKEWNLNPIGREIYKKLSYNPENEYIETLSPSRQTLNEKLNKKELRFIKYLEKGMKLKDIARKMHISMGSIGAMKKELKEKCYSIVLGE